MSSNRIIFVCLVIFLVVGYVGSLAGYSATDVSQIELNPPEDAADSEDVSVWDIILPWGSHNPFGSFMRETLTDLPVVGGIFSSLGFISELLSFQLPGMPVPITLFFWALTFMLTVAVARVIGGLITGGGD